MEKDDYYKNIMPDFKLFELPGWVKCIGRILTCQAFLPQEPFASHGHHPFDRQLYDQPQPEYRWPEA